VLKENNKLDFFMKFFDESLFIKIVEETNNYAEKCMVSKPDNFRNICQDNKYLHIL
jgi:hypothetical protein